MTFAQIIQTRQTINKLNNLAPILTTKKQFADAEDKLRETGRSLIRYDLIKGRQDDDIRNELIADLGKTYDKILMNRHRLFPPIANYNNRGNFFKNMEWYHQSKLLILLNLKKL